MEVAMVYVIWSNVFLLLGMFIMWAKSSYLDLFIKLVLFASFAANFILAMQLSAYFVKIA